ncbi:MAG: phosphorylase [Acidobacteriota bacterium]
MPQIALITPAGGHLPYLERGENRKDVKPVQTPFGRSHPIHTFQHGMVEFAVLSRRGEETVTVPQAKVPNQANIWALKVLGVTKVVSFASAWSLRNEISPGDLVMPEDILDLRGIRATFFEERTGHDFRPNPLFCPEGRQAIWQSLSSSPFEPKVGAVHGVTPGQRQLTRSEAAALRALGADTAGPSLAAEAFLARELELCYSSVLYIACWADGTVDRPPAPGTPGEGLLSEEEASRVKLTENGMPTLFMEWLVDLYELPRECPCKDTQLTAKRNGDLPEDFRQWLRR